ncbi:chalcone isomerase family protein [Shewanella salipaludis]|uniref:Chalcone isomerase n=1 Tax=Shewanella salipaludis TaxID=2723052 RepID=A0A972FSR0_9GAMM|nr:chalcone isomerase [Shewanella salipaludis]
MSTSRQLIRGLSLFLILSLPTGVMAKNIADVDVADTLDLGAQRLQLNGAGVRSKFFIDLYVGSLYLPQAETETEQVLEAPLAVIRLNITSGMISSQKMQAAIIEGFDKATHEDTGEIEAQIASFMALFGDEIKEGDQFTLAADKQLGVTAYKNGAPQATIAGDAFRRALLKIWLGDEPAQKSLKQAMLGG